MSFELTNGTQHLPIALYANDVSDAGALSASLRTSDQLDSQMLKLDVQLRNKGFDAPPELKILLPAELGLVEASEDVATKNGQTNQLIYKPDQHQLLWKGNLQPGSMELIDSEVPDTILLREQGIMPVPCNENGFECASFGAVVDFHFTFNGQDYTSLTISDNGFVVPGDVSIGDFTAIFNQTFPQADNLNNVIAPLWSEFYLSGYQTESVQGSGYLRTAIRNLNQRHYLVVEWDNVILAYFEDEMGEKTEIRPYLFQLWIEQNTDNIWFHYINVPSMPESATIGAENMQGDIGTNYYVDGQGQDIPPNGKTLKLVTYQPETASITANLQVRDGVRQLQNDSAVVDEDASVSIDVLNNDQQRPFVAIHSELVTEQTYKAVATQQLPVMPLDDSSLIVSKASNHGVASVEQGKIVYTPDTNFNGTDVFEYQVADSQGRLNAAAKVTLNVKAQNDAPVIHDPALESFSITAGDSLTISVQASDADDDELSFNWQQTSGVIVDTLKNGNQLTVSLSNVNTTEPMRFEVTASDGQLQSNKVTKVLEVKAGKKSGGISGPIMLLLLLSCCWLRWFVRNNQFNK
ncbi:Ig-like domain-containing protein [Neptunicella marina]|uniref:Cadherin-like domain-containing protein n=1 Tax=Neptunicella marina TaxID=2125989 RepID=A0A8J6IVR3_9ALTE|nr:Ig-like domain-containing protein [Neptunicella marina]MBC3767249.1 cadherin-like domain-containing protein [Neptunicella marina]